MKRIMFVCHGNICRSPMAEFIFKDMCSKQGLDALICSSATSTEEIYCGRGNPVYPPAREELARHGLSCEGKRAVQLRKEDYDQYDLFVAMDTYNVKNIMRIFGNDPAGKVFKIKDFSVGGDVADPWYSGDFATTYEEIYEACLGLIKEIKC